jgi:hypothetical protein
MTIAGMTRAYDAARRLTGAVSDMAPTQPNHLPDAAELEGFCG